MSVDGNRREATALSCRVDLCVVRHLKIPTIPAVVFASHATLVTSCHPVNTASCIEANALSAPSTPRLTSGWP